MKVLVATKNPGKIEACKTAFDTYFEDVEVEGIKVPSGVGEEPLNDEIYIGSKNRVNNLKKYAKENNIKADYYVSVESGITNSLGKWMIVSIATIENEKGEEGFGTSPAFPVPDKYVDEIINTDLGRVMDKIFSMQNLHLENGGINLLTKGAISRKDLSREAIIMALTEHINGDTWK